MEIPVKIRNTSVIKLAILVLFVACTATTALNVIPAGAQSPSDWIEYSNNPVFGQWLGGPKAYYPKVIYDAGQFSGHGNNAYYKMWFGSSNGIGYAYSNNGTSWTAGPNPLGGLAANANHPLVMYDPGGFGGGAYYKIWYWNGNQTYSINDLRYAESNDGTNWTNDQSLTQDGIFPLVTGNPGPDWNAGSYGPCDIIYNQNGSNSFDDGSIWNNKYVFYYMGTNGNNEYVGLAYSNNAIHWKRYGNNPVLSPGAAADWDNTSAGYCRVMKIAGSWHMWYGGGPGTNLGIGYATSPDGVNWTKHPGNPIFQISNGKPWRDDRTYTPWVLYDVTGFGGHGDAYTFKMWFAGRSADGKYSIGYASAIPAASATSFSPTEGIPTFTATILGQTSMRAMSHTGALTSPMVASSKDGNLTIDLARGTKILRNGMRVMSIEAKQTDSPPSSDGLDVIVAYEFSPAGTVFDPAPRITVKYDADKLPVNTLGVALARYNDNAHSWEELPSEGVAGISGPVNGRVDHFSKIGVVAKLAPPEKAVTTNPNSLHPSFVTNKLMISPIVKTGEVARVQISVANDGNKEGTYLLLLKMDGNRIASREITLAPGQETAASFVIRDAAPGKHAIEVAGQSGSFIVDDGFNGLRDLWAQIKQSLGLH